MNKTLDFFIKGFQLTNKHIEIFFILGILNTLSLVVNFYSQNSPIYFLLIAPLFFVYFAFLLYLPAVIAYKVENKKLDINKLSSFIWESLKRSMLPLILLFVAFVILAIFAGLLLAILKLIPGSYNGIVNEQGHLTIPSIVISNGIFVLFSFVPIFFSIEKKGLIRSLLLSVQYTFKHISFFLILFIINSLIGYLYTFIPIKLLWGQIIGGIVLSYTTTVLAASILLYYKYARSK